MPKRLQSRLLGAHGTPELIQFGSGFLDPLGGILDRLSRLLLRRLDDAPLDCTAHLVDIGGLVGVDPHRAGLVPQLDLGSIAHAFFQIVPQLPMHGLVERARAHLLVVEAPIEYRRERHMHVVASGRAVLQHLVLVDMPAHHVVDAELLRQVPVREPKEPVLISLAHVIGKSHNNVCHNHRVFARGALPCGLLGLVHALYAPLHRAPVRLALTGHHAPDHELTVLVRVVGNDHVVLRALRVDVVALQARRIAPVVSEHVPDRGCLVLRYVCHVGTALREILIA